MKQNKFHSKLKTIYIVFCFLSAFPVGAASPAFDSDKPQIGFESIYEQTFTAWDNSKFVGMWDVAAGPVDASNVVTGTDGYLKLGWLLRRVIASKAVVATPYVFETDFSVVNATTNGGVVIRVSDKATIDQMQEPGDLVTYPLQFNSEGIAFFASPDGSAMTVQFSGTYAASYKTKLTRIFVPAPAGVNLRNRGVLRIEDFGTSIYIYYNNNPYIRINLGDKSGTIYTSGTVYDQQMTVMGVFSSREVEEIGKVGVALRKGAENNAINIYRLDLKKEIKWDRRPETTVNTQYNQIFNPLMDFSTFNKQWQTIDFAMAAPDVAAGYFQFEWPTKRILLSKKIYSIPNIFEADINYATGNNQGGVVIRIDSTAAVENIQEPATGTLGFNKEGIAFYPSSDGLSMIVQFSGALASSTPVTQILVPKPESVVSLKNRGKLRIEDYGTSIYVFYNDAPYIKIILTENINGMYSSGTVYSSTMQILGTFSGMEVVEKGKIAIAQRETSLRLYSALIKAECSAQNITFNIIGKKTITDTPFQLLATSSSGLPVEFNVISGPATLNGSTITLNGTSGYVVVAANQPGDAANCTAKEVRQMFYVKDPSKPLVIIPSKAFSDNWVATDALGRSLPFADECRASRSDKFVGMFYYLWQADGIDGCPKVAPITNNTEQLADGKQNLLQNKNSYWAEPEAGYYRSTDPWLLRRNLQMLANAGVDFLYFDASNGHLFLPVVKELCKVSMQMRTEGIKTPYISWMVKNEITAKKLYDEFYTQSLYTDQWFLWNGKPLILKTDTSTFSDPILAEFFTTRRSWAWGDPNESGRWDWIDNFPQSYGWTTDKNVIEQISVAKGSHPGIPNGVSYHNGAQPSLNEYLLCDSTDYGLKFAEQWKQAHLVDPQLVMITQWNEWISGVYTFKNPTTGEFLGKERTWYAVDEFNKEFSRDIEPMKDGYTDNFYYQMVSNIRKYKGMQTQEVSNVGSQVLIDGSFNEWSTVSPVFKDPVGDTMHRNFLGSNNTTLYTNTTGRNDIIESRTSYDKDNLYFYVKTAQSITPSTDPNWMLLFIDADRNKATGWEGYDYIVNQGVKSATETTLKKWNGTGWSNDITIQYKMNGSEMELGISRAALLMDKSTPAYYFHWADNPLQLNNIASFFTDGESAPDRRFNYNYSTSKVPVIEQTAFKTQNIPGTIEFEDFDFGGVDVAYIDDTYGNVGGAYRPNESVDIETKTGGGYILGSVNTNEWLEYSVNVNAIGTFTASINYASTVAGTEAILYEDGTDISGIISFPSTGNLDTWSDKTVDLLFTSSGKHILKFFVKNGGGNLKLNNIVFAEKLVAYPGNGTGLNKSLWTAVAPRTWFKDSICSEIDPVINHTWADVSPGCNISNDFWNIRWQGQIEPLFSEMYTFYLTVNDMGKLWVNNQLVADGWYATSSGTTITGNIALTAGVKVPIKIDFAEKQGEAKVKLEWSSESNPRMLVPQTQLYPMSGANSITDVRLAYYNVYPNPASDKLTINSDRHQVENVKIIDLQGRIVFINNEKFSGMKTINITVDKGIYFLKLTGDVPFATQKLIIE